MTFEARAEVSENGKRVIMPNEMRVCLTYIHFFSFLRRQHKNEEKFTPHSTHLRAIYWKKCKFIFRHNRVTRIFSFDRKGDDGGTKSKWDEARDGK